MDSSRRTSLERLSAPQEHRTWDGYRKALASLTPEQLMSLLATINSQLDAERDRRMSSILLSSPSSGDLDRPVLSSTRRETRPSPTDRGAPPSTFRPPSAVDLLSANQRLGPRLAARLMIASARAQSRRESE